jgi:hypothetical protein
MQCAELQGAAVVLRTDVPLSSCVGGAFVVVADQSDVAAEQITAENVGYAFAWGFGAVVLFWFLGLGVGVARKLIRMA